MRLILTCKCHVSYGKHAKVWNTEQIHMQFGNILKLITTKLVALNTIKSTRITRNKPPKLMKEKKMNLIASIYIWFCFFINLQRIYVLLFFSLLCRFTWSKCEFPVPIFNLRVWFLLFIYDEYGFFFAP